MNGSRRRGRPRKSWTGQSVLSLLRIADDRGRWTVITTDASVGVPKRCLAVLVSCLLAANSY